MVAQTSPQELKRAYVLVWQRAVLRVELLSDATNYLFSGHILKFSVDF